MELNMELLPGNGRHLYEQIYEYIRGEIRSGKLLAGERLPSTRQLAASLKIARTTVELAYEQLEEEGYLVIRKRAENRRKLILTGIVKHKEAALFYRKTQSGRQKSTFRRVRSICPCFPMRPGEEFCAEF